MSYKSFEFSFPTRIVFGPGESGKAAEHAAGFKPKKIFLMTYADVLLPVVKKLMKDLEEMNIPYVLYDKCMPNPTAVQIDAAAACCREEGCDLVLGVGGGSVIDSVKSTALLVTSPSEGGIWDYVSGAKEPANRPLTIMLVVTIASTGSDGNESFVLTDREGKDKLIFNHPFVRPVLSVCDPELSVTLPPRQTALGAIDVFCHVLEQYLHDDPCADASDEMSFGLLKTVHKWAPVAVAEPGNMDARSNLLWCAILAMSRVLGVGHDENWLSHDMEHAVSAKFNLPHAAGMAGIMPVYLDYIEKQGKIPDKLKRLAELLGAESAAEGMRNFQRSLGLPVNLAEALGHGASEEEISEMAPHSLPWGPWNAGNLGEFSTEDAASVLQNSFKE